MIKRAPRQPRSRTRLPAGYSVTAAALTWTASIVATKARIVLNLPYASSGLPTGITVQGQPPTSITQVNAVTFDLGYAASVVTTNVLVVPQNVQQIRGAAGGYLSAGTFTFP